MTQTQWLGIVSFAFVVGLIGACSGVGSSGPGPVDEVSPGPTAPTHAPSPQDSTLQATSIPATKLGGLPASSAPRASQPPVSPDSDPTLEPVSIATKKPIATLTPTSPEPPTKVSGPTAIADPEEAREETTDTAGSWATPKLEVSVLPDTLKVGETATVTVKVTGEGGLPKYYLNLDSAYLKLHTPESVDYYSLRDSPSWTVEAVGMGSTSLSVNMNYETQICRNGKCFFNFTGTGSPSVAVTVTSGGQPDIAVSEDKRDEIIDTSGSWATPKLEISVVPETLQIGESAIVTVRAAGDGGLPKYRLRLDSAHLKLKTSQSVEYYTFSDSPTWTVEAVEVGTTSLSVGVDYETMTCRNGECYFRYAGTSSDSMKVTVKPATRASGTETYILRAAAEPFYSGGEVTLDPLPGPDGGYSAGNRVTLIASPFERKACNSTPYWSFTGWSGDVQGSEPTIEIIMDEDKSVSAAFREFFPPQC